jgi:DNA mismatch endonuclease, patch repair protein
MPAKPKAYRVEEDPIQVPRFCEENGFYTSTKVSQQMSKIRSKNTKPELLLRRALFANGIRFRINDRTLPGTPDVSIRKYKLAIFIDGEFWHGFDWSNRKLKLKSNQGFWIPKIERNIQRDRQANQQLVDKGLTVLRFWQQDVEKNLGACVQLILSVQTSRQEPGQFLYTPLFSS